MSVINDMLRDLDKRQAPELGGVQTKHQESLIGPQSSPYPKIIIIVLLVLLLSFIAYFLFAGKEQESAVQSVATKPSDTENLVVDAKVETGLMAEIKPEYVEKQKAPTLNNIDEKQKNDTAKIIKQEDVKQKSEKTASVAEMTAQKVEENVKVEKNVKANLLTMPDAPSSNLKSFPKTNVIEPQISDTKNLENKHLEPVQAQKNQAQKNMGVKLSPIALDQQMAQRALSLISQRKETEAYRELYAFIGENDEDVESRTVLATYLLNENRMAEVGDVLLNAPLSQSPKLRQIKARWYVQQDKHKLALYTLSSDLPDVSTNTDYYVLLAAYYQRYGTAKEAKETYSTLVDYDETVADWWAGLGLASDRNNEKEKAVYAYKQALDLKGLSSELLNFVKPRLNQLLAATQNQ